MINGLQRCMITQAQRITCTHANGALATPGKGQPICKMPQHVLIVETTVMLQQNQMLVLKQVEPSRYDCSRGALFCSFIDT